jgi:acetoin utilization deacetylase AcuC-like enzyme
VEVPCSAVGALRMPVVWAPATDEHRVDTGVWCGVTIENDELPERARVLLESCRAAGAPIEPARDHGVDALEAVHDPVFLEVLRTAHDRWVVDGHLDDPGNPYAVAYWFPAVAGRHGGDPARPAATIRAELGRYAMDTMTPVGPGTWQGAKAASDAAATGADLVLGGAPAAYAICRPPGHHAGPAFFGGSCYLNNAAVAAARLRWGGVDRVAIVDIDAHHGNGTQACWWDDPNVFYASLHVDPGAGWFPHTVGYADEVDASRTNCNLPLAPDTADAAWLGALEHLAAVVDRFDPDAVVVSLGVDAAAEDPNSPLEVTRDGFAAAGRLLGQLGRPTVLVHEGGYVLDTLAGHTLAVLEGVEGANAAAAAG